jgi:phosphate transport system protein
MAADAFSQVTAALGKDDANAARAAIAADDEIDRQYRVALRALKESLRNQPEQVTPLLRLVNSARNLKRIGDHIVNMADAILYING